MASPAVFACTPARVDICHMLAALMSMLNDLESPVSTMNEHCLHHNSAKAAWQSYISGDKQARNSQEPSKQAGSHAHRAMGEFNCNLQRTLPACSALSVWYLDASSGQCCSHLQAFYRAQGQFRTWHMNQGQVIRTQNRLLKRHHCQQPQPARTIQRDASIRYSSVCSDHPKRCQHIAVFACTTCQGRCDSLRARRVQPGVAEQQFSIRSNNLPQGRGANTCISGDWVFSYRVHVYTMSAN